MLDEIGRHSSSHVTGALRPTEGPSAHSDRPSRCVEPRWLLPLAVAGAVCGLFVHAALLRGFWSDDAFITYRYARNIATGLGPVFNPGEQLEGFSNPLFTFLLAGLYRFLPGPPLMPWLARGLGVLSAMASLIVLAMVAGAALRRGVALAVLSTAMCTSFALWSVGGLETDLYALLITLGFVLTVRRPRDMAAQAGLGLVLAALALSRPEGVLPAGALFLGRLIDPNTRRDWRGHATIAVIAAMPVAAYVGWRVAHFHDWLPNAFYAKRMNPVIAFWRGIWYLKNFFLDNGNLPLYAPMIFAFQSRDTRRVAWLGALVLAIDLPFNLIVGGDWMDQHRFVAPVTPILFLLVGLGWMTMLDLLVAGLRARGRVTPRWLAPAGAALALVSLALPNVHLTKVERHRPAMSVIPYFTVMAQVVAASAPPAWTIATHDIGAIGWYGQTRVLDMIGLIEPWVGGRMFAGDTAVVLRRPELVLLHYDNRTPPLGRWLPICVKGMDSAYVVPRGVEGLPRSLRVRTDLAVDYERRLKRVPESLRRQVLALHEHLLAHQPDMYPVLVSDPP